MYKALFVDDEPWALMGITTCIDWSEKGFSAVGKTTSSKTALEMIIRLKPDVVFVDIRMPEMSGLELIQQARKSGSAAEYVIVSGYADFSYAMEAIRYDVFRYILKPLDEKAMALLADELVEHLSQKGFSSLAFTPSLFDGLLNDGTDIKLLSETDSVAGQTYQAFITSGHSKEIDAMFDSCAQYNKFHTGKDIDLYMIRTQFDLSDHISEYIKNCNESAHSGISSLYGKPHLSKIIREAAVAYYNAVFLNLSGVVRYNQDDFTLSNEYLRRFSDAVKSKDYNLIEQITRELPELFRKNRLGVENIEYIYVSIGNLFKNKYPGSPLVSEFEILDYMRILNKYGTLENMVEFICEAAKHITSSCQTDYSHLDDNIKAALSFIRQNYNRDINLTDLARQCFLSPVYMCEKFKVITGKNFSRYITDIRLEKACELLTLTNYSISEVSELVGYNDYYYFNKLFKKTYGLTPVQYRRGLNYEDKAAKH